MTVGRPLAASTEQRSASRIPAERVPSIEGVRLSPGDEITLGTLDFSFDIEQ